MQVWKRLAISRGLPLQRIAQYLGVYPDQHQIVLTEKKPGCCLANLVGCRKMDKPVGNIDFGPRKQARLKRLVPRILRYDFVDNG